MPEQITWSRLAENDFAKILDYLDKIGREKLHQISLILPKIF